MVWGLGSTCGHEALWVALEARDCVAECRGMQPHISVDTECVQIPPRSRLGKKLGGAPIRDSRNGLDAVQERPLLIEFGTAGVIIKRRIILSWTECIVVRISWSDCTGSV